MLTSDFLNAVKNKQMLIVLDSEEANNIFQSFGFSNIANFNDFDFKNNTLPVFVLLTKYESQSKMNKSLWNETGGIFAHLAASKFDPAPETLRYSLEKLLAISDYQSIIDYRDSMYDKALSASAIKIHTDGGHCLDCTLADEVEVANYDKELQPGWLYSLAEFFETSIVNVQKDKSSFTAEGSFAFTGITHLENSSELKESAKPLIKEMVELSLKGNNVVTCKDNRITQITLGGQDFTDKLITSVAGTARETALTEFAFGTVDHQNLDWSINSVLNEGILGVHIGIGMGLDMPHVDFIAAGAQVEFVS